MSSDDRMNLLGAVIARLGAIIRAHTPRPEVDTDPLDPQGSPAGSTRSESERGSHILACRLHLLAKRKLDPETTALLALSRGALLHAENQGTGTGRVEA